MSGNGHKTRAELQQERAIAIARAEAAETECKAAAHAIDRLKEAFQIDHGPGAFSSKEPTNAGAQCREALEAYEAARKVRHEAGRTARAELVGSRVVMTGKAKDDL